VSKEKEENYQEEGY